MYRYDIGSRGSDATHTTVNFLIFSILVCTLECAIHGVQACGAQAPGSLASLHTPPHPSVGGAVMSGEDYLGWRRAAVIATPPAPQTALDAEQTRQMEQDATALQADVAAFLQSPQVLSEVLTPEHVGMLRPSDSDWSAYHAQCLKRVRDVNGLGGPRMHIVWHGTLAKLGRIPMLPDEGDSHGV